jgi:uncharacterized protein YfeS
MKPHDEDWELVPENGHKNAQILLTEAYYWDCTDENSPLGNDTGADVFTFYSEAIEEDPSLDPVIFLEALLESWEMLIDDWTLVDASEISQRVADNLYTLRTSDDAVIGLAFGMCIIHGYVDSRIREMALIAVQREKHDELLQDWSSKNERRQRLEEFAQKLSAMQVTK